VVDIERYARRWRWIRDLRIEPEPLQVGSIITFTAVAPIPYRIKLQIEILEMTFERTIRARVTKDLEGTGSIELIPRSEGTQVKLAWNVEMRQPAMRWAGRVARPLLIKGHDWAVRAAVASFRRRL
jgi:hypothetical protein